MADQSTLELTGLGLVALGQRMRARRDATRGTAQLSPAA